MYFKIVDFAVSSYCERNSDFYSYETPELEI